MRRWERGKVGSGARVAKSRLHIIPGPVVVMNRNPPVEEMRCKPAQGRCLLFIRYDRTDELGDQLKRSFPDCGVYERKLIYGRSWVYKIPPILNIL